MSDVKLERMWADNSLLCPCCNGNNLHPSGVHVNSCDETEIEFWCENCHAEDGKMPLIKIANFVLRIQFCKGTTYLDWHPK